MTERPEGAPQGVPPARRGASGGAEPSPWRGRLRWLAIAAAVLVVGSSPWWGGPVLTRLAFFRVRRVEITGVRHLAPSDVVRRLAIDTSASVWGDLRPLARRVERDPMVLAATVERRLPGTLVVHVVEKQPVALVAARGGFKVYDRAGAALPLSPDRAALDLPLLAARDTALLRLLGEVRDSAPTVYARISEVRRVGRRELVLRLTTVPVRAMTDVRPARLADLLPVEQDLARRRARVVELDLRYREQVVARLE
jgi:cell division protein FtsQ